MTKKEAMEKYLIPIPENFENYNKEEFREFDNMYLKSFYTTFYDPDFKNDNLNLKKEKVAIVLGGQAGAGKSSLVADAKRKFKDAGRRLVVIDDDEYRKFYPYAQEILKDCPESYTDITATATNIITPKILKFASENGYNFVFDGTMKNTRIVETMKTWNDYNIYVNIMATCGERSLISTAIRNAILRKTKNEGRLVDQKIHWDMYEGLPKTLDYIEKEENGLVKEIKIYTRSTNPLYPKEEYSSNKKNGKTSTEKLNDLRKIDQINFFENAAKEDIEYLEELIINLSPKEIEEARNIISFIKEEKNKMYEKEKKSEEQIR